ncbi:hypothetical protein [Nocardioides terrigena]|uniref:hypothetical protein n=1 Tax=Nocardioides terrigena TaxID=424797 RepID=UPI000D2FC5C7|nr:hypothetical protein [Nocardioides terrigena]
MAEPLLTPAEHDEIQSGDPVALIAAASQEVRSYCGWHIAPEVTETVTVEGLGATLLLPTLRLTDVTSIVRDDVTLDLTHVKWKSNGVVTGYAFGAGDYEVTFTHGYAETPADIAQAVSSIAADGIEGRRRLKSWARGPFSETFTDATMDPDRAALDRYRIQARP